MGAKGSKSKAFKQTMKEISESRTKEFYSLKRFSDDEIVKLVRALSQARVRVLELGGGITDMTCSALASAIGKKHCPIVELQLQGNNIGDEGIQHLAKAIMENPSIEKLDLSWNHIGDDGAKYLADAIRKSSLKSLDLAYNKFTDVGASMLDDAVKESRLKRLTLNGNARVSRFTVNQINETLAVLNSQRFTIAEVLCSSRYVKRLGRHSAFRHLPQELVREIIIALFGERKGASGK